MRLISRKIWRAFPELDQFDDATCKRYIMQGRAGRQRDIGVALILATLSCIWLAWMLLVPVHIIDLRGLHWAEFVFHLFIQLGWLWFPIISALIVRDIWLHHCVKRTVRKSTCSCQYSLLGLPIQTGENSKFVVCPECGVDTELERGHISEADINPNPLSDN